MYSKNGYSKGKTILLLLFALLIIVVASVYMTLGNNLYIKSILEDEIDIGDMFNQEASLFDITGGLEIRGISTGGEATGKVYSRTDGNRYKLIAEFINLPTPNGDDFYEGWIVDTSIQKTLSTGALELSDGAYVNTFSMDVDNSNFDLYVLTIEPNDGNPAPADHILEGSFMQNGELPINNIKKTEEDTNVSTTTKDLIDVIGQPTSTTSTEILE